MANFYSRTKMNNKKPIRNFIHFILNKLNLDGWILLFVDSLLKQKGWFKAFRQKSSIDKSGNPLPWLTYSFIDFIKNRLDKEMNIFEFGSGNSTLFFSKKVKSVTAVEHNRKWFSMIKPKAPSNVKIIFRELKIGGEYSNSINDENINYDIIIIDGEDRENCIYNSLKKLQDNGVFILDDSERKEYQQSILLLMKNNFKKIDFWGMAPGVLFNKCTTLFYKTDNCIGI